MNLAHTILKIVPSLKKPLLQARWNGRETNICQSLKQNSCAHEKRTEMLTTVMLPSFCREYKPVVWLVLPCAGDPCPQPRQLTEDDLEPCTSHRDHDYFAGSEIAYISAFTSLCLFPFGENGSLPHTHTTQGKHTGDLRLTVTKYLRRNFLHIRTQLCTRINTTKCI